MGRIGVRWFRTRLRFGAQLALLALCLNLVFAFGHHHFADIDAAAGGVPAENSPSTHERADEADTGHSTDSRQPHVCVLCATTAVGTPAATHPALLLAADYRQFDPTAWIKTERSALRRSSRAHRRRPDALRPDCRASPPVTCPRVTANKAARKSP